MYQLVLNQLIVMALIALAGFVFARIVKVSDKEQKFLSKLLLYFVNVCLIIDSFNMEYDAQKFRRFLFAGLIALIIHLSMIFVSFLLTHSKNAENRSYNHIDRLAMVLTNCGFIGIPLIKGTLGNAGVFYLMGYLTVFNILAWTWGLYQMSGTISLKKIIVNPVILSAVFGILLFLMPFTLPEPVIRPIKMIGDCNTALAMVMVGILFADFHFSSKYTVRLIKAVLGRLVLCPLIALLIIFAFWKMNLNVSDARTILFVILICASCPTATTVPGLAALFDKDAAYASLTVSVSSLLCIFSVPAFVALAEQLLK